MSTASPWSSPACATSGTDTQHETRFMNVLVLGGGGREHALAWKLAASPRVATVFVAPGNAGTARETGVQNVALDTMDFQGLADFAAANDVGLTLVGPEAPLVE